MCWGFFLDLRRAPGLYRVSEVTAVLSSHFRVVADAIGLIHQWAIRYSVATPRENRVASGDCQPKQLVPADGRRLSCASAKSDCLPFQTAASSPTKCRGK